jgi:hypothetical protein
MDFVHGARRVCFMIAHSVAHMPDNGERFHGDAKGGAIGGGRMKAFVLHDATPYFARVLVEIRGRGWGLRERKLFARCLFVRADRRVFA